MSFSGIVPRNFAIRRNTFIFAAEPEEASIAGSAIVTKKIAKGLASVKFMLIRNISIYFNRTQAFDCDPFEILGQKPFPHIKCPHIREKSALPTYFD